MAHERATPKERDSGLQVLAVGTFNVDGDVHKLVTFLNQTLKDKGFIFGISKHADGLTMTVYQTDPSDGA